MKIGTKPNLIVEVQAQANAITQVLLHRSAGGFFYKGFFHPEIEKGLLAYAVKKNYTCHLPLDHLPAYSKKVLEELMKIGFGQTLTYSELAIRTNNPKACRAVGQILGKNRFPLFIPCHRVLGKQSLGGFTPDLEIKKELLSFEKNIEI